MDTQDLLEIPYEERKYIYILKDEMDALEYSINSLDNEIKTLENNKTLKK